MTVIDKGIGLTYKRPACAGRVSKRMATISAARVNKLMACMPETSIGDGVPGAAFSSHHVGEVWLSKICVALVDATSPHAI